MKLRFRNKIGGRLYDFRKGEEAKIRKMREVDKAVELLRPLLNGLAEGRKEVVNVYADVCEGEDYIIVIINKAEYGINVTAENTRSMVKSVIDVVALKL